MFFAFLFFAFFITEKKRNLLTFDMLSYVSKSHGSVARPVMRGRRMWSDHVTPYFGCHLKSDELEDWRWVDFLVILSCLPWLGSVPKQAVINMNMHKCVALIGCRQSCTSGFYKQLCR